VIARLRDVYHPDYGARIALKTPYHPDLVNEIKARIRYPNRAWDTYRKIWLLVPEALGELERICFQYGFEVVWDAAICPGLPAQRPSDLDAAFRRRAVDDEDWAILGLHPSACREVAEAAYKALIKKHHPDHGGDLTTMQLVNTAWSRIKRTYERRT
jgi:hypothetical protein